jgi:hypothetical protein
MDFNCLDNIVTWSSDYRQGLDWWPDILNSYRSLTTSNYEHNRFTNSHTLEFFRAHSYVFSVCCVFTSLLVTASNGGRSPSPGFPIYHQPQLPAPNTNISQRLHRSSSLTNSLNLLTCPAYNISERTAQKTPFLCCCANVTFVPVGVPTWSLLSHCLGTAVVFRTFV